MRIVATASRALGGVSLALVVLLATPGSGEPRRDHPGAGPSSSIHGEILAAGPRPGDVLLRRGTSVTSHVVLATDPGGRFSHAGVVVRTADGLAVVHSLPPSSERPYGGVVTEPLDAFLTPPAAVAAALLRVPSAETTLGARVARRARALADSAVPFDGRFDLSSQNELYCTELVWWVYRAEGVELIEPAALDRALGSGIGGYLMPSDIEASPRLKRRHRVDLGGS